MLQSLKRQRWNGIANTFTDYKAIKMANLVFFNWKGDRLDFTFLAFVNAPGYAEFILDYC